MSPDEIKRFDRVSEELSRYLENAIGRYRTFDQKEPSLGEVKVAIARVAVRRSNNQASLEKWIVDMNTAAVVIFNQREVK